MTLRAGMDKVLIKPDEAEEATEFGFVVPKTKNSDNPVSGIIASVGKPLYYKETPADLVVGRRAFFRDMAGAEFKYEGETYYSLLYEEVAGVADVED